MVEPKLITGARGRATRSHRNVLVVVETSGTVSLVAIFSMHANQRFLLWNYTGRFMILLDAYLARDSLLCCIDPLLDETTSRF